MLEAAQQGSILVVDDEPYIRELISRVLHERGYSVLTAGDGEEALAQIMHESIRLILCNLRMPRMNGPCLYAHLVEISPALAERVVFCTGDIANGEMVRFLREAGRPTLLKPFDLDQLVDTVSQYADIPIRLSPRAVEQVKTILQNCHNESGKIHELISSERIRASL